MNERGSSAGHSNLIHIFHPHFPPKKDSYGAPDPTYAYAAAQAYMNPSYSRYAYAHGNNAAYNGYAYNGNNGAYAYGYPAHHLDHHRQEYWTQADEYQGQAEDVRVPQQQDAHEQEQPEEHSEEHPEREEFHIELKQSGKRVAISRIIESEGRARVYGFPDRPGDQAPLLRVYDTRFAADGTTDTGVMGDMSAWLQEQAEQQQAVDEHVVEEEVILEEPIQFGSLAPEEVTAFISTSGSRYSGSEDSDEPLSMLTTAKVERENAAAEDKPQKQEVFAEPLFGDEDFPSLATTAAASKLRIPQPSVRKFITTSRPKAHVRRVQMAKDVKDAPASGNLDASDRAASATTALPATDIGNVTVLDEQPSFAMVHKEPSVDAEANVADHHDIPEDTSITNDSTNDVIASNESRSTVDAAAIAQRIAEMKLKKKQRKIRQPRKVSEHRLARASSSAATSFVSHPSGDFGEGSSSLNDASQSSGEFSEDMEAFRTPSVVSLSSSTAGKDSEAYHSPSPVSEDEEFVEMQTVEISKDVSEQQLVESQFPLDDERAEKDMETDISADPSVLTMNDDGDDTANAAADGQTGNDTASAAADGPSGKDLNDPATQEQSALESLYKSVSTSYPQDTGKDQTVAVKDLIVSSTSAASEVPRDLAIFISSRILEEAEARLVSLEERITAVLAIANDPQFAGLKDVKTRKRALIKLRKKMLPKSLATDKILRDCQLWFAHNMLLLGNVLGPLRNDESLSEEERGFVEQKFIVSELFRVRFRNTARAYSDFWDAVHSNPVLSAAFSI